MMKRATRVQFDAPPARGVFASARAVTGRFVRTHAVLVVSAVAALATVPFVPPDAAYLGYFDLKTLACLFSILALVGALRNVGAFEAVARRAVARFSTCRSAVAALVAATLVVSMVATNDMALIMLLPLSAVTLLKAGWERVLPFAFIMQNLAANFGGMILPFGNPQNLYLFERFAIPPADFLATMALPFAVSVLLIAVCCAVFVKPLPARIPSVPVEADNASTPAVSAQSSHRRARAALYAALLALVIASVFRLVPYPVALVAVIAALALLDRLALRATDFGLLLTFACFFVFAGNMARIPAVEAVLSQAMQQSALLVSAGASQIISNVPAAVLLSHFATDYHALLVGVNIGGAGTLVASLASLITLNHFRIVRASFPGRPELARHTSRTFLAQFTLYNGVFLVILLVVCFAFSCGGA
ncbi:citrate transporter [Rubneribacter badeniensis]|uniref:Citrate transporter n=1 Tax=Rubneribacter badeniensis TaxID=2070688 RepID=A0A2K2U4R0_9ACTN|nr:citrate transporter [Gordonibacter sp. An232A]PNV65232.1 citrate transporter [Rubneribacter badeniensis]